MEGEGSITTAPLLGLDFFQLKPEALSNFDALSEKILDIITNELGFIVPSVIMYDKSLQGLRIINYRLPGGIETVVNKALGRNITDIVFPLSAKKNLFVRTYLSKTIHLTDSVRDMVVPVLHPRNIKIFDKLLGAKMMAVVPILVDNSCIGVFGFGSKSHINLSDLEKYFLQNLSQQIGHYLKHAWIIKMLLEKTNSEVIQNERLQRVLAMNQESIESLYKVLAEISNRLALPAADIQKIQSQLDYLRSLSLLSGGREKKDSV
jgi:hypothetical protein